MKSDVLTMTAGELLVAFERGTLSPVEVVESVLAQAERINEAVNAFCYLDREFAIAEARHSEKRWRQHKPKSPIDGIPISVKDNIGTSGMPTRFGSRAVTEDQIWIQDDPSVARLRGAGGIIFGKTCCPDFSHKVVTDSPLTGVTRNPWNTAHTPGGSSGGASAAIAALAGPLALCTDAGGSIRIPAAFTGTFGFKPSFGRVPQNLQGASGPLGHVGPITRSVADAALMMNFISLPDVQDWYALPYQRCDYIAGLKVEIKDLRIAYSRRLGFDEVAVASEIEHAVQSAAGKFSELGASVEAVDPPAVKELREIHRVMWASLAARLADSVGERRALLAPSLQSLAQRGEALPREAFVNAVFDRGKIGSEINSFFQDFDIVLAPVYSSTAPSFSQLVESGPIVPLFTNWCNVMGLPAASIACGLDHSGLPIGLQVIGGRYADAKVLSVCFAFEQLVEQCKWPALVE